MLERQREYHPSFVLMGGGFERSLLPWGRPIPNGERMAELDGGEELPLSECFRRSWEEEKHLFITGSGGVGKTVALLTFATEKGFLPRRTTAVYIPLYDLSQYADERRDCVDEYLGKTFSKAQLGAVDALSRRAWDSGPNVILLMDGYNEIPPERRRHVEVGMRKWAERPGVQVVTTSRVSGLIGLAHTTRITLRGLAESEVAEYLRTRHPNVSIPEAGTPFARLLGTPLMLRLYAGVEEYRQRVDDERVRFRDSRTAGDLVWNYLQAELYACMGHRGKYSERDYAEALLLTLPYVCWHMESAHEFKVDKEKLRQYVGDAAARWEGRDKPEYVVVADGGSSPCEPEQSGGDVARAHLSILEGVSGLVAKRAGGDYSLAHQSLRDGLAAIHLFNVAAAPYDDLPTELKRSISEYVKDFSADLLGAKRFLALWETNRGEQPTDVVATNNLLRIVHKMKDGDLTQLDWSGMDIRGMSLFPLKRGLRLELSHKPERFERAHLDVECFMPQGHTDSITSACFSPDGSMLVSGSWDNTVCLWDVASGRQICPPFKGHSEHVKSACFSPDGTTVLSAAFDGAILWDAATGGRLRALEIRHRGVFHSGCFSPDGATVLSITSGGAILWDAVTGGRLRVFEMQDGGPVDSACFSPDGATVLGVSDGSAILWDAATGGRLRVFEMQDGGPVDSACFSPDGATVLGVSDGSAILWDAATGGRLRTLEGDGDRIRLAYFSPDGTAVLGISLGGAILWDAATGGQLRVFEMQDGGPVDSACFSPDGATVLGVSDDAAILWDAATGGRLRALEEWGWHSVKSARFSPDGATVLGISFGGVLLWDTTTGKLLRTLEERHSYSVKSICFSPDGTMIASGSNDGTVRLWDTVRSRQQLALEGRRGESVESICFSPDGTMIASGSNDGTVRLWDTAGGKQLLTLKERSHWSSSAHSVCFSPAGTLLAGGFDHGTVILWNIQTGELLYIFQELDGPVNSVCFSSDGIMLAGGSGDGTVMLWDVATGRQLRALERRGGPVLSICFSPDGGTLAGGSHYGTVQLWDTATGGLLHVLKGDGGRSICFTPDGTTLIAGSADGVVRMWDVRSGRMKKAGIYITRAAPNAIALSHRGLHIAYLGNNGMDIATFGHFALRCPSILCLTRATYICFFAITILITMPILLAITLIDRILATTACNSRTRYRIRMFRDKIWSRFPRWRFNPLLSENETNLAWPHVSIVPLYGIDVSGLDFTKARIDRRTRKILRKNGAKA